MICALGSFLSPFTASIFLPTQGIIEYRFGHQPILAYVCLQMFAVFAGIIPVLISPLSDKYGRKTVLIACLVLFCITETLSTFSPTLWALTLGRMAAGASVASVFAVANGCIFDVFPPDRRIFGLGLLVAPSAFGALVGPLVGGLLTEKLGWRSTLWFPAAVALPITLVFIFLLPETLPVEKRSKKVSSNPLRAVRELLLHPRIFWIATARAVSTAEVFSYFVMSQAVLIAGSAEFTPIMLGVSTVPYGVGSMIGAILGGRIGDLMVHQLGGSMRLSLAVVMDSANSVLFMIWALLITYVSDWGAIGFTILIGIFNGTARGSSYASMIACDPARAATITGIAQLWTFIFVGLWSYLSPMIAGELDSIIQLFIIFTFMLLAALAPVTYLCYQDITNDTTSSLRAVVRKLPDLEVGAFMPTALPPKTDDASINTTTLISDMIPISERTRNNSQANSQAN
ncbi:MAG: MFS transporter, partial [archaeon]|nr:MFS transporter [archaeon]